MSSLNRVFTLTNTTLAAAIECLLAVRLTSDQYSTRQRLIFATVLIVINYSLWAIFHALIYPIYLSPLARLPGTKRILTAHNRGLIETKRPTGELFVDIAKEYPGEELVYISPIQRQVMILKPRLLADVLVHRAYDFVKPDPIRGLLRPVLGEGLVVIEGDRHKFLRKNTMPAFGFRQIKDLYPMMWTKATRLAQVIQQQAPETQANGPVTVELSTWASRATLDIIGIAGLGRQLNALEMATDPLLSIYEQLLDPSRENLLFALAKILFGTKTVKLVPWHMNGRFDNLCTSLHKICTTMIDEKREAMQKNADDHFDLLSLLIKSNNFSDDEIRDQMLTFLAAGHETTSSSLTWAGYLLAKRPDLQVILREEVNKALPSGEIEGTFDLAGALQQLPYLNGVINETLRLYPTVPATVRTAIRDTKLGEQVIPKGTNVSISMWMFNRSPELWGADANEFRPERWITEAEKPNQNGGRTSNYAFTTFLHGPRSCIGEGFARAELRCLLAALVRAFSWELAMDDKDVMPRGVITIKPEHGLYLKLTPVNVSSGAE